MKLAKRGRSRIPFRPPPSPAAGLRSTSTTQCELFEFMVLKVQSIRRSRLRSWPFSAFLAIAIVSDDILWSPLMYCSDANVTPAASAFVLGVQKCGTSTMHNWLVAHKDIVHAKSLAGEPSHYQKELHMFDNPRRYFHGVAFYNKHFVDPLESETARYIEATPNYFYNLQGSVTNMRMMYGRENFRQLKMILIVKDPVERFVSWWNHFGQTLNTPHRHIFQRYASMNEYINVAYKFPVDHKGNTDCDQQQKCLNVLSLGVYSKWLRIWLDSGASTKQFEIVFLDEFQNNHESVSERVQRFLGIRLNAWDYKVDVTERSNHRNHRQMLSPKSRAILEDYYFRYNCDFAKIVDGFRIRKWEDMMDASSGWIPSKKECADHTASRMTAPVKQTEDESPTDPTEIGRSVAWRVIVLVTFMLFAASLSCYIQRRHHTESFKELWKRNKIAAAVFKAVGIPTSPKRAPLSFWKDRNTKSVLPS